MAGTKSIVHDQEQSRFVIYVDDQEAGFAEYSQEGNVRDFNHTVVDPEFRGQGLSKPLIQAALDDARADGMQVTPSCPAVERYIEQNPQYRDLLA